MNSRKKHGMPHRTALALTFYHPKKNGPVKMSSPSRRLLLYFRIYWFGLFGASTAFGSATLAAIGLPESLPKRVK